ncbi:Guanyl-specific ribonuclease Sa [Prauserella aidingensis]|nr:Guanyl-specific ribonuclease Sa [Prauserella aidingensis]
MSGLYRVTVVLESVSNDVCDDSVNRSFLGQAGVTPRGYGPLMSTHRSHFHRSRLVTMLLGLLLALVGGLGSAAPAVGAEQAAPVAAQAECGDTSGFDTTPLGCLPSEATDTYELIQSDGPYPYPEDDTVFQNREGLLPDCDEGYYREYTVETPGLDHRGARRIVAGSGGEHFYTDDHYASFVLIDTGDGGTPPPQEPECGDTSALDTVARSSLSQEAQAVVADARGGATGTTYENREGVLPDCEAGYYQLFEVGADDRVISGEGGEIVYTPDHYSTFQAVDVGS